MTPQAQEKLTTIFRAMFNQPELELAGHLTARDIPGWDSLKHVSLVVTIESEFGIRFANHEIAGLENVGDLMHMVAAKTGEA